MDYDFWFKVFIGFAIIAVLGYALWRRMNGDEPDPPRENSMQDTDPQ